MQSKPTNWVTGFKRSPRASNVQMRDMGLFMNSSGRFETLDDSWDSIHSEGMFISGANKLYFRDEDNKDIYINSPADNQLELSASLGVIVGDTLLISDDNKIQLRNTDDTLYINSPATNQIRLEATAGVSINTTDMEGATGLNVHGTIRATGMVLESAISAIEFTIKPDSGDAMLHFEKSDASREFTVGYDDGNDLFVISDNDAFGTNDRLVINADGDVGIGTSSSPTAQLQVGNPTAYGTTDQLFVVNSGGDASFTLRGGHDSTTGDVTLKVSAFSSTDDAKSRIFFGDWADEDVGMQVYDHADDSMAFTTNTSEALRIGSDGTLDQKSNYLVNSQTVNDLQTRSSYQFRGDEGGAQAGNDAVIIGDTTILDGASAISAEVWFKTPTPAYEQVIFAKAYSTYVFEIRCLTSGFIAIRVKTDVNCSPWPVTGTVSVDDDKWHHVALSWDGTTINTYVDGVLDATGTLAGVVQNTVDKLGFGGDISSADVIVNDFVGEISKARLYNRALTADEVKASYSGQAVPYADIGANQAAIYASSGDFTGDMTASGGAASNVTQDGKANSYKFTVNSSAGTHYLNPPTSSLVIGKHYRVETYYYIPSGNANIDGFRWQGADAYGGDWQNPIIAGTYDAWTLNSQEFIAGATVLYPVTYDGATNSYTGNGTDAIYFHEVVITQIGNVAEYLPTSIGATQWLDTSGNGLDGTVTGATQTHPTVFGGKVGIGNGSPSEALHIQGSNDDVILRIDGGTSSSDGKSSLALYEQQTGLYGFKLTYGDGGNIFQIKSRDNGTDTDRLTIDRDTGNVGIGYDVPAGKLDVISDSGLPVRFGRSAVSDSSTAVGITYDESYLHLGGLEFTEGSSRIISFGYHNTENSVPAYLGYEETSTSSSTYGDLIFATRNVGTDTNPTERLRIGSDRTLDQKSNYLVNSQTVNDLQTKQSLRFDGTDDYVTFGSFGTGFTEYTVEGEFYFPNDTDGSLDMLTGYFGGHYWWIGRSSSGFLSGQYKDGGSVVRTIGNTADTAVTSGVWHHFSFVVGATAQALYIDGVLRFSSTYTGIDDSTFGAYAGRYASGDYGDVEIGRLRYYNRALSADEVKASYSGQAVPYVYTGASQTNRVTNGTFAADTDWTKGTGWTIGSGVATSAGGNDGAYLSQVPSHSPSMIGKYIRVEYEITAYTSGSVRVLSSNWSVSWRSAVGTYSEDVYWDGTDPTIYFQPTSNFVGSIDNVVLYAIGAVAEYLPTSIGDTTWLDTSGNALHGTVTGATQVGKNIFGGPVGIGTNDPYRVLEVVGGSNAAETVLLQLRSNYATANTGSTLRFVNSTAGDATSGVGEIAVIRGSLNAGDMVFRTATGSSGTTEKMRIDEDGAITSTTQPAFQAKSVAVQSNIAINTAVTVVLGTEIFDQGGDFASNTFTAPVTGKYQLNFQVRVDSLDTDASYYSTRLITSNRTYYTPLMSSSSLSSDPSYWTFASSVLADMDASDTAYITIWQAGGAVQSDISTDTYFSGFLAC